MSYILRKNEKKKKSFIAAEATMKTKAFIIFMLGVVKK